jgi:hypothetical protein
MTYDPPINAREAPSDFPGGLPSVPPTEEEISQLLEVWTNVTRINSLRGQEHAGTWRSEYMLWTTNDSRQFRVMWNAETERFETSERTKPL